MEQEKIVISVILEGPKLNEVDVNALAKRIDLVIKGQEVPAVVGPERTCDGIDVLGLICIGRRSD